MRALLGLIAIVLVIASAVFFADRPGIVSVEWQGWRVDTSVAAGLLILGAAVVIVWLLMTFLAGLIGAPRRRARRRREKRLVQGYRAVTLGLVAVAGGDGREAERQRQHGEHAFRRSGLPIPPLTRLLSAQAALLRGEDDRAKTEFGIMLKDPDLAFLGYRGLIAQALKAGDDATALDLIEKAKRIRPDAAWMLQSELALEARGREWRRAGETLRAAVKQGAITPEAGRQFQTALLVAHSEQAEKDDLHRDALSHAAQAVALSPEFVPAAVRYARLLGKNGKTAKGRKVIEAAWQKSAHPELAETYASLGVDETPATRFRHFERLAGLRPNDPAAHLAAAEIALSSKLWGEARRHLEMAGSNHGDPWPARLSGLMAALERGDRADTAAAEIWEARAKYASAEPRWICDRCDSETHQWDAICPHCQAFGTLTWRAPASTRIQQEPADGTLIAITDPLAQDRIMQTHLRL